jgi:hypothetical protein
MRDTDTPELLPLFKVQGRWLKLEALRVMYMSPSNTRTRLIDCDTLYYMFDIQELFQVARICVVIQTLFLVENHYRKIR